jgi:prepilin-type N-terminal cleavage/methylation domain-containing protein
MSKTLNKSGFSLVEVVVTILLLVVIALGGSAVMSQTGGGIQRQQNKREALVAANTVMERIWNQSYSVLQSLSDSTINETVTVNGVVMNVTVDVGVESTDPDGQSYIELTVDVDHLSASDDIRITTRRYEFGISRAAL